MEKKEMKEMSEMAKRARASYMRQWRRKNPRRQSEYMVQYWERKAAQNNQKAKDNLFDNV